MGRLFRFLLLFIYLFVSTTGFAIDYVFTGNGSWNDPANWQGGLIAPAMLTAGNTITIQGTAQTGVGCTTNFCSAPNYFGNSAGTIIIAAGGSLTFNNSTQFFLSGTITVNGTMITTTTMEIANTANVFVNGTLSIDKLTFGNQGTVTINSGGVITNKAIFTNSGFGFATFPSIGKLIINQGGVFNNMGTATLRAGNLTNNGTVSNLGKLDGTATITGSLANSGNLAPGTSPGIYTVTGDYTASSTAVHNFEVGGTAASSYDQLNVSGNVFLNGTLNIILINGFLPSNANPDIPIITGTINGTFSTVTKPAKYLVVYNGNSVALRYVSTLPVFFKNVDVKREGGRARVAWRTEGEVNVSHYEIERSYDAQKFTKVGEAVATSQNQYSFLDAPLETKTYYRIKSVDRNGKYEYSITVMYFGGKASVPISVYPLPAVATVNIQHPPSGTKSRLTLTAMDGRMVQTIYPVTNAQKTTLDLSPLSKGTYVISYYEGNNLIESTKVVKE